MMSSETQRPKKLFWATNGVYGVYGEAWDGSASKVAPSTSYKQEGIKPGDRPDAPTWNWWRDQVARFLQFIQGIQLANWKDADFSHVTTGAGGWIVGATTYPIQICFDPSLDGFTAIDTNGETIVSRDPNYNIVSPTYDGMGLDWDNETANPRTLGYNSVDLASDGAGERVSVDGAAIAVICHSTAVNTWATRTLASSGWQTVTHDWGFGPGLWVVAGNSGILATSANGVTWTARTSGVSGAIISMLHSRDSNNAIYMGLTSTKALRSTNGTTWTNNNHSLTSVPIQNRLAYSKEGARWITLLTNGDIAYSDDNGATWTQVVNPFGISGSAPFSQHQFQLTCDGQSGWIVHHTPDTGAGITTKRWISIDNGITWHRQYEGLQYKGIPHFGGDRFVSVGSSEASYSFRVIGD